MANGRLTSFETFIMLVEDRLGVVFVEALVPCEALAEMEHPPDDVILRRGDWGPWVIWAQWRLYCLGYDRALFDGFRTFGEHTQMALREFQRERLWWLGLSEPTGEADPATLYELGLSPDELALRELMTGVISAGPGHY